MTTTGDPAAPQRHYPEPQQAGFVELLFDVVFVFGLNRLSERLTAGSAGGGYPPRGDDWREVCLTVVLFLAMWWVWYRIARATNRLSPARPAVQLMVIGTMFGTLLMAASLPDAEGERGAVFAIVYVILQVPRTLWLVWLSRDRLTRLVAIRILFWSTIGAGPWLAGIFAVGTARLAWWTLGIGLDYLGGVLDFPTPRLGRAGLRTQGIAAHHLVERYRQFMVIAFGETILTSGLHFTPYGFEGGRILALAVSFIATILMWQIYSYRAGELLLSAVRSSRTPAHLGALASYVHLIMVAGLILTSVGDTIIIGHPFDDATPARVLVVLAGPGLFLVGRAVLDYIAFSHVSWSRPIGLLALAALAPVAVGLPAIAVGAVPGLVLGGVAISNIVAWRLFPREPTPVTDH